MFDIDNFVVDRVLYGWAESLTGDILYTLKQITNVELNIEAGNKDQLDARDMLVKRFYEAKSGTLDIESTVLSFSDLGAFSGSGVKEASNENLIETPKLVKVAAGDSITLSSPILDTVIVYSVDVNGNLINKYERSTQSSSTEYSISGSTLYAPTTDADDAFFLVKYIKQTNNGIKIVNRANRFPKTVCLNLKVIGIEPCEPNNPKIIYIQMPYFQPSPEISINFNTEGIISYSGTLTPDVCDEDKRIYSIYAISEAEEAILFPESDLNFQVLTRPEARVESLKTDDLVNENQDHYKVNTYLQRFLKENYSFI